MLSQALLELRSNGTGSPHQYLIENRKSYEPLDVFGHRKPRVLMVLGRPSIRMPRQGHLPLAEPGGTNGIYLDKINPKTLQITCTMHGRNSERSYCRSGSELWHLRRLSLANTAFSAPRPWALYCQVLQTFSDAILIFVSEFGDELSLIDFLCFQIQTIDNQSMLSHILLVHDKGVSRHAEDKFRFRLLTTLLSRLRSKDPTQTPTVAGVKAQIASHISISHLSSRDPLLEFKVNKKLQLGHRERDKNNLAFSGLHLKELLQRSFGLHAQLPSRSIDPILLSRALTPVPRNTSWAITAFFRRYSGDKKDALAIIASALIVDAYPVGTHAFQPLMVFDRLYRSIVSTSARSIMFPDFTKMISDIFVADATELLALRIDPAKAHAMRIRNNKAFISLQMQESCSFCLLQRFTYALDCGHLVCVSCSCRLGEPNGLLCPVCQHENVQMFNAPTASIRNLHICGSNATIMLDFLKRLQRSTGMVSIPLTYHFDNVYASGIGVFLAIALFLERWSIADCQHHLVRLKGKLHSPKYQMNRKTIYFGKGLKWSVDDIVGFKKTKIDLSAKHGVSISVMSRQPQTGISDLHIQCSDTVSSEIDIGCISKGLMASLFYVELEDPPVLGYTRETIKVKIHCRIPPGLKLLELMQQMYRRRSCFVYRGCQESFSQRLVCNKATLQACKDHVAFTRDLYIDIQSIDTSLEVHLASERTTHHIGGTPCVIGDLVKLQRLDCCFRRAEHIAAAPGRLEQSRYGIPRDEVQKLLDTLDH